MTTEPLYSIAELAAASRLSRRAIRFYVQRELLPAPLGRGRGRHYGPQHLERLEQIQKLQEAGHSLAAIRRILHGEVIPDPEDSAPACAMPRASRRPARISAQLWTRIECMDGVELHLDTSKVDLELSQLLALQQTIQHILEGVDGKQG